MPEVQIEIGGRNFEVACQAGEEHYLYAAAKMLNEEAAVLAAQIGRILQTWQTYLPARKRLRQHTHCGRSHGCSAYGDVLDVASW